MLHTTAGISSRDSWARLYTGYTELGSGYTQAVSGSSDHVSPCRKKEATQEGEKKFTNTNRQIPRINFTFKSSSVAIQSLLWTGENVKLVAVNIDVFHTKNVTYAGSEVQFKHQLSLNLDRVILKRFLVHRVMCYLVENKEATQEGKRTFTDTFDLFYGLPI